MTRFAHPVLRKVLLAAMLAAGSATGGPALAFDGMAAPGMWSGFYVGGHFGFGGQDYSGAIDTSSSTNPVEDPGDLNMNGVLGGVQAGYNVQSGYWVFGVEGDISFVDWSDRDVAAVPDGGAAPPPDTQYGDTDLLVTVRGRAGVVHEDFLFYGTAGLAFANADFAHRDDASGVKGGLDFNDVGFVIGAGVEKAIKGGPWSIRGEGLYFMFDDRRSAANLTPDADPGDRVVFEDAWALRLSVNYSLGELLK